MLSFQSAFGDRTALQTSQGVQWLGNIQDSQGDTGGLEAAVQLS